MGGIEHKLKFNVINYKNNMFNYPDNIDLLYQPYFMRGSLGQPEYIRTYDNVSRLFQDRLNEKWGNDKRKPVWTNRNKPEFYKVEETLK